MQVHSHIVNMFTIRTRSVEIYSHFLTSNAIIKHGFQLNHTTVLVLAVIDFAMARGKEVIFLHQFVLSFKQIKVNDQKPQHWPHFNKPLDLNEYSKNGGESTSSGFVSAGSDESARQEQLALVKRRDLTGNQLNQSPIFVRKQILAEKQSNESCRPEEGAPQAQKASTPIRLMRSIRMDIDLNRPLSPEENAVRG